jgi:hypothetical protein
MGAAAGQIREGDQRRRAGTVRSDTPTYAWLRSYQEAA